MWGPETWRQEVSGGSEWDSGRSLIFEVGAVVRFSRTSLTDISVVR